VWTLEDYESRFGIDFRNRTISPIAQAGKFLE